MNTFITKTSAHNLFKTINYFIIQMNKGKEYNSIVGDIERIALGVN